MASPATGLADLDAVVLAGGRGTRMGGVDKGALTVDGVPLVERAVAAARGVRACVVVGPPSSTLTVPVVREEPAFSGPVAGVTAGLAALPSGGAAVLVLSCDLADASAAVQALLAGLPLPDAVDGVCLGMEGRPQWLAAVYRREPLEAALAALGDPAHRSFRDLVRSLTLSELPEGSAAADVDTWEDLRRARGEETR